jgi:Pentapeptide repeats (8 copies)
MDPTLTAAAIGVGGTVIVGVAGFWANVRNTNKTAALTLQGQVTDRYTKAIEQLGSKEIEVRIGGIYALERIARDSARDHPTVMEVLASFVREHSREQWPLPAAHEAGAKPPERSTRPDVQAAITVIGRRTVKNDGPTLWINLAHAELTRANLVVAHLEHANLTGAHLEHAYLAHAYLEHADLTGAHLEHADLTVADLTSADLTSAHLTSADLTAAHLRSADLTSAHLTGANLRGTHLAYALWPLDMALPEGWRRDEDSGRLMPAADQGTAAPD